MMNRVAVVALLLGMASPARSQAQDSAAVVAKGKSLFAGQGGGALCFSCHGMNARGTPGVGPDLTDGKWLHGDGSIVFLDSIIRAGVAKPRQSAAAMPPMGGAKLDSAQVRALAAYIRSLNKP
jgi:mono/diheme cytochrome c family protein